MCGIAGYIEWAAKSNQSELEAQGRVMAKAMLHRGPDAAGVWVDAENGLSLCHARLSVIDLSDAGLQPMTSACGRFVMVYNGEVYNAAEILDELGGNAPNLRGHSDSEVILEACAHWGVEVAVEKFIGMFAFAIWDKREKTLTMVRDRFGIKPFYYGEQNGVFLFGSELKALMAHDKFEREIDRNALASYMRFNYVAAPQSIFKNVIKLQPGHILTVRPDGTHDLKAFWSLRDIASHAQKNTSNLSDAMAEDRLDLLLRDAVKRRMVADVPLGAFLSGGIDSSTVVALMQAQSSKKVHTYSIGMQAEGYNEAKHAKAVAAHLGTDHTELYVTPQDAQDVIPDLASYYDEPFADSSQIPTFLVSKLARQSVTVALSGDGGDELFCGYNRYLWGDRIWQRVGGWPNFVKSCASAGIEALKPESWDSLSQIIPNSKRPRQLGIKMHKVARALTVKDDQELYRRLTSFWEDTELLVPGSHEPKNILWDESLKNDVPDFRERMQLLDALTYMPDDILCKVDRASMAVSLEARVPLLDHRVAEFAFHLPKHQKVRDGQGKWLLRNVLARYVPRELFERPKMGFGIPIGEWLKGPLRDWAEDLLSVEKLEADGLLNAQPIREVWQDHLSGKINGEVQLWTVLMFQAWREKWML